METPPSPVRRNAGTGSSSAALSGKGGGSGPGSPVRRHKKQSLQHVHSPKRQLPPPDFAQEDGSQSPSRTSYRDQLRASGQALQRALHRGGGLAPKVAHSLGRMVPGFAEEGALYGGDASARHPAEQSEEPGTRGVSTDSYFATLHMPALHGVHNTLLSVHPHAGSDMGMAPPPPYAAPGYVPSPMGSPVAAGPAWQCPPTTPSPVGCAEEDFDLMKIAMPQGCAMDKEQIAERLRAAAPEAYED